MWGIFIMQSKCVVHGRVLSQCMVSSWCRASSQCRSSSECRMSSSCRVSLLCSVSSGAGIFTVQGIFIFRLSSQCMLSIVIHGIFIEQGIFIVQGLTLRERGRDGRAVCCWWMRKITDRQQGLISLTWWNYVVSRQLRFHAERKNCSSKQIARIHVQGMMNCDGRLNVNSWYLVD